MMVDWHAFTPVQSLIGGAMIGLSASLLFMFAGRIAGVSGIIAGLIGAGVTDRLSRAAFVVGVVLAPSVTLLFTRQPHLDISAGFPVLAIAGFLVGIGTRYGSGCTSGHGVCGISRLSKRSIIATATFMTTGFVTVYVMRHWLGG